MIFFGDFGVSLYLRAKFGAKLQKKNDICKKNSNYYAKEEEKFA